MAGQDQTEHDARRRPQRGISDSRRAVEGAAQQLARLRDEMLRKQALRRAAELPLPSEAEAARDSSGNAAAAPVPRCLSSRSSVLRDESSASAWVSARSASEAYRDARSSVDSGPDSDEDEQTSALTPLRPDEQEEESAARTAGLTSCASAACAPSGPASAERCDFDENEWSPGAGPAKPLDAGPPRQLQRINKGSGRPVSAAPVAEQSSHRGVQVINLEDSSDDDWQATANVAACAEDARKPLQRLQKAGIRAQHRQPDDVGEPASNSVADALEDAMASLTVRLPLSILQRSLGRSSMLRRLSVGHVPAPYCYQSISAQVDTSLPRTAPTLPLRPPARAAAGLGDADSRDRHSAAVGRGNGGSRNGIQEAPTSDGDDSASTQLPGTPAGFSLAQHVAIMLYSYQVLGMFTRG